MGDASAGRKESLGLYPISIPEREGEYNGVGSDWMGLEVSTYTSDQREGNERNLQQSILEPVVFPWLDTLSEQQKKEFYFMEDGAKIHKGFAKLPRQLKGLRGFKWPSSSPDLNPIKKIWRWMKNKITKLETIPLSIEDIWEVVQELWSEVDPKEWRYLTKRLTCKLEDVIKSKGMATIY